MNAGARGDVAVSRSADIHFTAAETAGRLGVTVRALRVYERYGLVRPRRTAAGWRVYGTDEFARLHQVIALKDAGLKLAQIAKIVRGNMLPLDDLLGTQEQELLRRKAHTDRALTLVRRAREHIADGKALSVEDFITLIKETRMPSLQLSPTYKALWGKHIKEEKLQALHPNWSAETGARFKVRWLELIAEAERLKDSDPGSPPALDLARRALSLVGEFTRFDPDLMASLKRVFEEGYADPETAGEMPYSQGMRTFMDAAVMRLHAVESRL
jgi:DNA-binding transcriptional MerR regulator